MKIFNTNFSGLKKIKRINHYDERGYFSEIFKNNYFKKNKLSAEWIGRGGAWLDTGSIKDFYDASAFVSALENRQGLKIACLEEIAYVNQWIKNKQIRSAIKFYGKCDYSNYLKELIK